MANRAAREGAKMNRSATQLRADALAIWQAATDAVRGDRLVRDNVRVEGLNLMIGDEELPLADIHRIAVVGAGKAGASMAAGLEQALGPQLLKEKQVAGWINVPADCLRPLAHIHLHPARPAGVNEPAAAGVLGAQQILELVAGLDRDDLCLCLISGGGSALLPAPIAGISLEDKQAVTKFLSAAGANIRELNTVRKQLSRIKGGGLARACRAGRMIALVISDVMGDPLDVIASGPTAENSATPQDALRVLSQFDPGRQLPAAIYRAIESQAASSARTVASACPVSHLVIGNNAVAVDAAGIEAERRGYSHAMVAARQLEGPAEDVGRRLAEMAVRMRDERGPDCLITGGEPIVRLVPPEQRGLGGRNQQLVLAALSHLLALGKNLHGIALLSGGTDGEDGPTDAAGAIINAEIAARSETAGLKPDEFLLRNDAYHFFEPLGGLIKTGPTHTNVCDVRVVVVDRVETPRGGEWKS